MQFGFIPDEIEVSERCVSRDNFPALKLWCWRCSEENTKRTYGTYRTPVSFEQEASVLKGDALIEIRRTEKLVRGSCWFTGAVRGFPHPSTLQLRKASAEKRLTTDRRLFTSVIISWHTTTKCRQGAKETLNCTRSRGMAANYGKLVCVLRHWHKASQLPAYSLAFVCIYVHKLEANLPTARL